MRTLLLLAALVASAAASAHELRSIAMFLDEPSAGIVTVRLKTPLSRDGDPMSVVPRFSDGCQSTGESRVERDASAVVREWQMQCAGGLAGHKIRFEGLDPSVPDAVVSARFADGMSQTIAVDRHDPIAVLQPEAQKTKVSVGAYLPIGIEHILLGPDHLLFVLGLMMVVFVAGHRWRMLVSALTAFTVAHSITLALAVLGIWGLPPKAVEILIALSIVLLAVELARARIAGRVPSSLTFRRPWLVAFVFGLLHGFGFAGALSEVGLPEQARGWALFLFNAGVEVGQLLFVGAVLGAVALVRSRRCSEWPDAYQGAVVTALGGVSAYWMLERVIIWTETLHWGI